LAVRVGTFWIADGVGWLVDSLLDRIAGRRAELAEQAERLRKELAEVEAELARVGTAEQVVVQLLAASGEGIGDQDEEQRGGEQECSAADRRSSSALTVPHRVDDVGVADLPAEYRRLVEIVAEQAPVACKRVAAKLGLTTEPRHVEGVRVKLKRLVARGWLAEVAPGRFAMRP
jgi:cell division septum initiation protein DivIVA